MLTKSKKSLGQNFLIDNNILQKIVNTVPINKNNEILEIGPGTGNLTDYLIKKNPKKIFVIEKDSDLSLLLSKKFKDKITIINEDILKVDGDHIKCISMKDPKSLPWDELGIDVVVESTGIFRYRENLEDHIKAGAKKVILTVPPKDELDATIVLGVNDHLLDGTEKIISNASCTTNCAGVL